MNEAYRPMWVAAGYGSKMGSVAAIPPPDASFLRLYHLTSAEFAVSDIGLGHLKVARFSDLNDPFELMALNLRESRTRKVVREFKDAYDSKTGLLCFSSDWTSPVLWSHYAAKHSGICLGFDLQRGLAEEVQYDDK